VSTEQTEAVVLRMHAWSETSLIGALYTRSFGKISVVAKGARRPKSPFEVALDLLSVCRIVFIAKSGDSLNLLTEAKLARRFRAAELGLLRLYCGYYVAELLDKFTHEGVAQPELYDLVVDTLQCLEQGNLEVRAVVLRFEMQLLRLVGHAPSWRQCVECGLQVESVGWITYGAVAGGVLCPACSTGGRQLIRIPARLREEMEKFASEHWSEINLHEFSDDSRAAVRAIMTKTISSLLDQKLRLPNYLGELGR
jgi:DNA repair protein RecO (recombination protein O)